MNSAGVHLPPVAGQLMIDGCSDKPRSQRLGQKGVQQFPHMVPFLYSRVAFLHSFCFLLFTAGFADFLKITRVYRRAIFISMS